MRVRVEVPCSVEEKAAWEAAAGEVALARWIRGRLNAAVATPPADFEEAKARVARSLGLAEERAREDREMAERLNRAVAKAFRPDFKGGKR